MSLLRMAWRYLLSRGVVTTLTVIGIALGAALVSAVLTLRRETERTFLEESSSVDLVVGAKGSPLQLVLSSLYHLDIPTGNVPWLRYEQLRADERVEHAIPLGLGDNFRGFRIVGTTPDYLEMKRRDAATGEWIRGWKLGEGRAFSAPFEVVLGAEVARQTGLHVGSSFAGSHGLAAGEGSEEHKAFPYQVVGVLSPSASSVDRAILTPLESIWTIHEHEAELQHEHKAAFDADEYEDSSAAENATPAAEKKPREVTAILVQLKSPGTRMWMENEIRNSTNEMAAIPVMEMLRLYDQVLAPLQKTLMGVAYLVVLVSGLTILTTLYQAAERRRREVAIMRALGAHPGEVFLVGMLEAFLVTMLGIVAGFLVGHAAVQLGGVALHSSMGVRVSGFSIDLQELLALALVGVIGVLAGLIPATLAYRGAPADDLNAT